MNKELQKLLKQINDKKNEVKSLVNDGKLDKAKAAKEELKELQNRFDLLYDLDEDEQGSIEDKVNKGTAKQVGGEKKVDKKNLVKAFVNIVKAGFLHREADEADVEVYKNALTSDTSMISNGYTPESLQRESVRRQAQKRANCLRQQRASRVHSTREVLTMRMRFRSMNQIL